MGEHRYWVGMLKTARQAERRDLRRTHLRAKWDLGMWIICASNCAIWTLVVWIFIQWLRLKGEA